MRLFRLACALAALLFSSVAAWAQNPFALKDGDRIVFYGDSITDQRQYSTLVETYVLTRFPQMKVSFVHSGWGGDKVTGGQGGAIDVRLQRDVVAHNPTVLTILLGMNDGYYKPFDAGLLDTFSRGYQRIVDVAKNSLPGVRITAIQTSPYDEVTRPPIFEGGYNNVLLRHGEVVAAIAKKEKLTFVDFNAPILAMLEKAKAENPALAAKIIPDRVHPGPAGHHVMAATLLKAWNAPAVVTAVEIDVAQLQATRADNTQVTEVLNGDTLSWIQTDLALPLPIEQKDTITALGVRSSDVINDLAQQPLKIINLEAGKYDFKIDGVSIGSFTEEQLAGGINLATLQTPMMTQAAVVHAFTLQHNNVHFTRWRNLQVPLQNATFPAVQEAVKTSLEPLLAALDAEEASIVAKQRAAAQPIARRYELIPIPLAPPPEEGGAEDVIIVVP